MSSLNEARAGATQDDVIGSFDDSNDRMRPLLLALVAVVVVVGSFWMFVRAPVSYAGGDSLWIVHTSASVITDGDLDLTEYSALVDRYPVQPPPHLLNLETGRVDFFPWGASVVSVPFVVGQAVLTNASGGDFSALLQTTLPLFDVERQIASAIAAVTVGLLLWVLFLRLRSIGWASALALSFAFGTSVMSTTSRNLWIQGPGLLLVVSVLLLAQLLSNRRGPVDRGDVALVAGIGLLVALAYATRPTLALLAPLALALAWYRGRWRLAGFFVGSLAVGLAAFVVVNVNTYGEILPPYYEDRLSLGRAFPEAVAANLISPARGLLVWSPVLAGGIVYAIARWRETSFFDRLLLFWVGVHLLAVSALPHWWAGATVGARFMADVLPALFMLLTPPIQRLRAAPARLRYALTGVLVAAALWAGFVNIRASHRMSVVLWNWPSNGSESIEVDPHRVWDWRDPQFLR